MFELMMDETGDAAQLKKVTDEAREEGEKILENVPSMEDDTARAIEDGVATVRDFNTPNGMKACPLNGRVCGGWCGWFNEQQMVCSVKSIAILLNLQNYGAGK